MAPLGAIVAYTCATGKTVKLEPLASNAHHNGYAEYTALCFLCPVYLFLLQS